MPARLTSAWALVALFFAFCTFALGQQPNSSPKPGMGFRGMLEDAVGAPLTGVLVELQTWNGEQIGTAMTETDGSFVFPLAAPGAYRLQGVVNGQPFSQTVTFSNPAVMEEVHLPLHAARNVAPAANPASDTVSAAELATPSEARNRLKQARQALADHQVARAMAFSNAATAQAPNWAEPYFFRGVLNLEQHQYALAAHDLRSALARHPGDAMTLAALGSALERMHEFGSALRYVNEAARHRPIWQTYFTRAQVELDLRQPLQAISDAGSALSMTPPGPAQCHLLRANGDLQLHRFEDAAVEIKLFLKDAPNAPEAGQARTLLANLQSPAR